MTVLVRSTPLCGELELRGMGVTPSLTFIRVTYSISILTVVCSQLPHTLDLTWFEQIEGWTLPEPSQYKFSEFPYYETRKNEALFREYVKACEQSPACWSPPGSKIDQTNCVRQCISPICYTELYSLDPLEEGEIDVRLNSFKGCFHQLLQHRRNY